MPEKRNSTRPPGDSTTVESVNHGLDRLVKTLDEVRKHREARWSKAMKSLEDKQREIVDAMAAVQQLDTEHWSHLSAVVDASQMLARSANKMGQEIAQLVSQHDDDARRVESAELGMVVAEEATRTEKLRVAELEQERDALRDQVAGLQEQKATLESQVEYGLEQVRQAEQQVTDNMDALTSLGLERSELQERNKELNAELEAAHAKLEQDTEESEQARRTWESLEAELNAEIERGRGERDELQRSGKEQQDAWERERAELEQALAKASQQLDDVRRQRDTTVQERNSLSESVKELQQQLSQGQPVVDAEAENAEPRDELLRKVERLERELTESREGMDQLLEDCDRLTFENIRLKSQQARAGAASTEVSPGSFDGPVVTVEETSVPLDDAGAAMDGALGLVSSTTNQRLEPVPTQEDPDPVQHQENVPPSSESESTSERAPDISSGRQGSYSLIGEGISEESLAARRRRRGKKK